MQRVGARLASVACFVGLVSSAAAEPPAFVPCDDLPEAVARLAGAEEITCFGIVPEAKVAVAALAPPGEGERSVVRFAEGSEAPREVRLAGRVVGLALTPDGTQAYAIVRATDRKGAVRSVDLVRVDLALARTIVGATLPATAGGLAVGSGGSTLLVAAKDEIRTFQLPSLVSGPLYRALGDNVGIAPIGGSSFVLLAQSSRIVLADLSAPQDRDGLALSQEAVAPAPLRAMLALAGDRDPIALGGDGRRWCVRAGTLPAPAPASPPPAQEPAAEPPEAPPPVEAAPAPPPPTLAPAPAPAPEPESTPETSVAGGSISGSISGPAVADVASLVLLGPDNVLRETARAIPDEHGRYEARALQPGAYRVVAAGKGGRVLICDPPFITIRVSANGAIEAPDLKVLRAQ